MDARVLKILEFVSNCSQVDVSAEETTIDTPSTRELLRRAARESIVMLKNDDAILPLKSEKIAMIGHHAILPYYAGGEPALPRPVRYVTPLQGVQERAEPQFCFGAYSESGGASLTQATSSCQCWRSSTPAGRATSSHFTTTSRVVRLPSRCT